MPDVISNEAVALYVAAAVALVVMIGFFIYLWRMDRSVRELKRALDARERSSDQIGLRSGEPSDVVRPQRLEKELSNGLDRP